MNSTSKIPKIRDTSTVKSLFFSSPSAKVFQEIESDLHLVFTSKTTGFRELLATIVYAKFLDSEYSPKKDLYSCSPRALYERGIKPVLDEREIPSGQSGPLNIAKATPALNEQWAAQRRPKEVAEALLRIVGWLGRLDEKQVREFAKKLGTLFDLLASEVGSTMIAVTPQTSVHVIHQALIKLIENFPLGGDLPQVACGLILQAEFNDLKDHVVQGAKDSASTTNRASKKPGDLTVLRGSRYQRIYEVTVKKFSEQRIREANQSIRSILNLEGTSLDIPIQVLCRPADLPENIRHSGGNFYFGEVNYKGLVFSFYDIYGWLGLKLADLNLNQREFFIEGFTKYLNGLKIPPEVREAWVSLLDGKQITGSASH